MRIIKLLLAFVLAVLAVTAGVFVVAIVAGVIAIALLVRAIRRRVVGRAPHAVARTRTRADHDVIDVAATEVPPDNR